MKRGCLKILFIVIVQLLGCSCSVAAKNNGISKVADDSVYYLVEKMPMYCGGEYEMNKYVSSRLKIPFDSVSQKGLEGKVRIRFVVTKDGHIRDVKSVGGNSDLFLDNLVIDILKTMDCWIAGEQDGIRVDVYYTFMLNINLKKRYD